MNIGGLFGALTPVFFVLALGYFAGKRNAFDADQSAGLSKLALTFALPASLFVSMTEIRKDLLLEQGRLVLALILSHAGLFVVAWLLLRLVKSLSGTASIIYALMLATSATPVFGLAVLGPLLGPTSPASHDVGERARPYRWSPVPREGTRRVHHLRTIPSWRRIHAQR